MSIDATKDMEERYTGTNKAIQELQRCVYRESSSVRVQRRRFEVSRSGVCVYRGYATPLKFYQFLHTLNLAYT